MKKFVTKQTAPDFFGVALPLKYFTEPIYIEVDGAERPITSEERNIINLSLALSQMGKDMKPEDICKLLNVTFEEARKLTEPLIAAGLFRVEEE